MKSSYFMDGKQGSCWKSRRKVPVLLEAGKVSCWMRDWERLLGQEMVEGAAGQSQFWWSTLLGKVVLEDFLVKGLVGGALGDNVVNKE